MSISGHGVYFYACGNTLKSLKYGASTPMALQKQGYACNSW
jgi:intracellular sulfur oxidation DsrE/DsrF family protein